METIAFILAGGRGSRLDLLSEKRVKPAVPFAGKYRIIDFTLSNCCNSGIYDIAILTQYLPLSLNEHIGVGKPWDLDRRDTRLSLLQPYKDWYMGTADAVRQNLAYIKRSSAKYVLILSGDHIYKMDYRKMLEAHKANNTDLTIAVQPVPWDETNRFGILETDDDLKITKFLEKPEDAPSNLASMGIYIFNREALINELETATETDLDFGKHIMPRFLETQDIYAYVFEDYWKDVGTYDSYLEANLELTSTVDKIPLDMYDRNWRVYTRSEEMPAVKIGSKAKIKQGLISNGSIVAGEVDRVVLSPGVVIHPTAKVKNSVILNDSVIMEGAVIENCIIDKDVVVGKNAKIGVGDDYTPNKEKPHLLSSGINVIAKGIHIPEDTVIERNCRITPNAVFNKKTIKSGTTL
ncbi:MAG: glucose-1-phosphate adenylyltransferase family protein [Bacillota bacterium]